MTVCGAVQLAMPETVSAQTNVTVTLVLFQPAALASGDCVWLIVGGVWSILTWMLLCVVPVANSSLPALSTLQNVRVCMPSPLMLIPVAALYGC